MVKPLNVSDLVSRFLDGATSGNISTAIIQNDILYGVADEDYRIIAIRMPERCIALNKHHQLPRINMYRSVLINLLDSNWRRVDVQFTPVDFMDGFINMDPDYVKTRIDQCDTRIDNEKCAERSGEHMEYLLRSKRTLLRLVRQMEIFENLQSIVNLRELSKRLITPHQDDSIFTKSHVLSVCVDSLSASKKTIRTTKMFIETLNAVISKGGM